MKKILTLFLSCVMTVALGAAPVYAEGRQTQTIQIEDRTYTVQVTENIKTRQTVVTDENGEAETAVFNKEALTLTIDGETYPIECEDETPSASPWLMAKAKGKTKDRIRSRKTYKISGKVIAKGAKAVLAVIITYCPELSKSKKALMEIFKDSLSDNVGDISITITKYQSGARMTSGEYKGMWKFWTRVTIKIGKFSFTENHDICFQR